MIRRWGPDFSNKRKSEATSTRRRPSTVRLWTFPAAIAASRCFGSRPVPAQASVNSTETRWLNGMPLLIGTSLVKLDRKHGQ
jgi:hypothetical protein